MSNAAWRDDDAGVSVETVSRMLRLPIPTIRTWERRYGVPMPARTAGGHRRYSHADALELRAMRDEIGRGRDAADAAALLLERRASPVPDDRRELTERFVRGAGAFDSGAMEEALERAAADLDVDDAVRRDFPKLRIRNPAVEAPPVDGETFSDFGYGKRRVRYATKVARQGQILASVSLCVRCQRGSRPRGARGFRNVLG